MEFVFTKCSPWKSIMLHGKPYIPVKVPGIFCFLMDLDQRPHSLKRGESWEELWDGLGSLRAHCG